MRSLYLAGGGPLCHQLQFQPIRIFKRTAFRRPGADPSKPLTQWLLPSTPARTRFAPSPTGYLHLGSIRTALYNYLLAKATGGQFLLRLEDTDQTRIVHDSEKRLYEDLKWAGLNWDEGPDIGGPFGPYTQSQRLPTYQEHINKLLENGHAYRCFCSQEEMDEMRIQAKESGQSLGYNGKCSHIPAGESARRAANGEPHVVRFRSKDRIQFSDLVYGVQRRDEKDVREDHFVLMKQDGYPTYHLANVVDDHLMKITHVIRGAEWLTSMPKHAMLYEAFDWKPPAFAHVALLADKNGKLSKRRQDVNVEFYRNNGISPIALLNYAVLHGWNPGKGKSEKGTKEVMDLQVMIDNFHLRFTKGVVQIGNKLDFFQDSHTKRFYQTADSETFASKILPDIQKWMWRVGLEQYKSNLGIPGTEPQYERASQIGELVPEAKSLGEPVSPEYIEKIFNLERASFGDAEKFVLRNMYLFWEVSDLAYEEAYTKSLKECMYAFWIRRDTSSNAPVPTKYEDMNLEDFHHDRKVSDIIHMFEKALLDIPAEDWTLGTIGKKMKPIRKSIFWQSFDNEIQECGTHWLRWVICARREGPSVQLIMEVLGKEQVMKRMKAAGLVALRLEAAANEETRSTPYLRDMPSWIKNMRKRLSSQGQNKMPRFEWSLPQKGKKRKRDKARAVAEAELQE